MTDFQKVHVIIVEDNQNSMVAMLKLLKYMGIEHCNWYPSGNAVLGFVRAMSRADAEHRPDLILLDINLPGEDGYHVLAQLRADSTLRHTRVVAATARISQEEIGRAQAAGFDGFIGKPFDVVRFPDQIQRILAGESVWEK
jgi:two-component system, cell cycle response regulator DivK